MKKFKNILLYSFLFVLVFWVSRYIYMNYLYGYTLEIFAFYYNLNPADDFWFALAQILLLNYFCTTFIYQIIKGGLTKKFIIFAYIMYFLILIYLLLFKSMGITGYNLNIFAVIGDILNGDAFVVLMNIIIFIPLGFLFKFNFKTSIIFIAVITIVEIIQMIFNLGICDIDDILLNYIGFIVGSSLMESNKLNKLILSTK